MAESYGRLGLGQGGSLFYSILKREVQEARENNRTSLEVLEIQCETIFFFVLSLYTKLAYFVTNLIGQGPHVIEDVKKGKVQALKKYCEVALAAYQSFKREEVELMECMDLFIMNDLTQPIPQGMLARIISFASGQPSAIMKQDMSSAVKLLKQLIERMEICLKLGLIHNLTFIEKLEEKLDKISRNVGIVQRSVVRTIEAITSGMYWLFDDDNHLQKSSCFRDYLCHHKLEGSFRFSSFTRPLPKLWMCSECWQWNKNELLYANTQSAACEHCGQPIIPDTIGKLIIHNASLIMVNW